MNYPCGHCLEYLLDEMRQHQNEYEAHGVYFVLLERAGENYADILLRKYGLENAANVIVDRRHYPSVILNGKGIGKEQHRPLGERCPEKIADDSGHEGDFRPD